MRDQHAIVPGNESPPLDRKGWNHPRPADGNFIGRLTLIHVTVLSLLAVLAVVAYLLPQAELRAQQSSAAVLNLIDRQSTLLERSALVAEMLAQESDPVRRQWLRTELGSVAQQMAAAQERLRGESGRVPSSPALDDQIRNHAARAAEFAASPQPDPTVAHGLAAEALGALAADLEEMAVHYQKRDEAGVRALRHLQTGTLVATLTTLLLTGLFVFRPMVQNVRREHEQRLRSERLAVAGTMAAKLAHEIRNPLGSIRLNLDCLGELLPTPEAPALLRSIDAEVRRIQRISDGYLQFARLPRTTPEAVDLNPWLDRQIEFCAAELTRRRIELRRQFAPALPSVVADTAQLWQAILNLLRNAMEAMPEGGTLTVATAHVGRCVEIRVSDTGPGIRPEVLERIWEPFFSTKPSGSGLGLLLVQQILSEQGGTVACESTPGRGTTFRLRLPLRPRRDPGVGPVASAVDTAPTAGCRPPQPTGPKGPPGPPDQAVAAGDFS